MGLQPCTRCLRHVRDSETACPFCGAAFERVTRHASRAGRLARAALFASASLAACDQGKSGDPTHAKETASSPRIHGTVVDQSGTPVVGASVQISQPGRNYQATTNHAGHYALDELEPGEYGLNVSFVAPSPKGQRQGFANQQVTVVAGKDQAMDLTLQITDQSMAMPPYGAPPRRTRLV